MDSFSKDPALTPAELAGDSICKQKFQHAAAMQVHPFMQITCLNMDDEYLPEL